MNYLGDDIKIDDDNDILFNPGDGDFATASGIDCLLQDIVEEFEFSLFDDPDSPGRGSVLYQQINAPGTTLGNIEIKQEIKRVLSQDPRINAKSIKVTLEESTEDNILKKIITVSFKTMTDDIVKNLIIPVDVEEL